MKNPSLNIGHRLSRIVYCALASLLLAASARSQIVIGGYQPLDADLTAIAALADPGADRILFWDDSLGAYTYLAPGNSVSISSTTLDTIQDIRTTATPTFAEVGINVNPESVIHTASEALSSARAIITQHSSTSAGFGGAIRMRRSRGTISSPADVQNGDAIGQYIADAYSGGTWFATGELDFEVDGTFTSGQRPPSRLVVYTNAANGSQTARMRILSDGKVELLANVASTSSTTGTLVVTGGAGFSETVHVGGNLAIGTTAIVNAKLRAAGGFTGSTTAYGVVMNGSFQSDVTASGYFFYTGGTTAAASFTLSNMAHYTAVQTALGGGSTVTNQVGFWAQSSLTGATNNYGFRGQLAAAGARYNLYMDGTAANYLAGDLQLSKTITAAATTGARTINHTTGTVNFAAAATSLVVTNSLVTANSIIICTVGTNDTTMKSVAAVAGSGSFTLYANAAPTAETRVNFLVTN